MLAEPRAGRWLPWLGLLLMAVGMAALPLDLIVSRWLYDQNTAERFGSCMTICEAFGNGASLPCFAWLIWLLAPGDRRRLPRLIAAAAGGGLLANVGKLLVARMRPCCFCPEFPAGELNDTFRGFVLFGAGGSAMHSFPSGHTALAFALAVALIHRYPAGRPLFILMAIAVGVQRVVVGMHYPSDVLCAAGLGLLVGYACCYGTSVARGFDVLERRWSGSQRPTIRLSPERSIGRASAQPGSVPSVSHASTP